eukprot:14635846-Alexandrium_andersonii.AAC.1
MQALFRAGSDLLFPPATLTLQAPIASHLLPSLIGPRPPASWPAVAVVAEPTVFCAWPSS